MARPKKDKAPDTSVRIAFTGPNIEHDALIDQAVARNEEDRKRASSAGESRSKIKAFLESTGMNGKALSWLRQIIKTADKDDGQAKAMDVIMSLEKGLEMVKAHVAGQGTAPMSFDPPAAAKETASNVVTLNAPITQLAEMPDDPGDDFLAAPAAE